MELLFSSSDSEKYTPCNDYILKHVNELCKHSSCKREHLVIQDMHGHSQIKNWSQQTVGKQLEKIKKPLEITVLMISVKKYQTSKRTDVEVFLSTQSKFYLEYL